MLTAGLRSDYHDLWRQLRAENAPLRVLKGRTLRSAPISFFDALPMAHATEDWQRVVRVIGGALASQLDDWVIQSGDRFLGARLNALVESGRLECRGPSPIDLRSSEVRLPSRQA